MKDARVTRGLAAEGRFAFERLAIGQVRAARRIDQQLAQDWLDPLEALERSAHLSSVTLSKVMRAR
jgi:hypothetical protein